VSTKTPSPKPAESQSHRLWRTSLAILCAGLTATATAEEPVPPSPSLMFSIQSAPPSTAAAPSTTDLLLEDRPIGQLRASLQFPAGSTIPANAAKPQLEAAGVEPQAVGLGRGFCLEPVDWDATALRHRPLYFEEPNLERLGYYYGGARDGRCRRFLCQPVSNCLANKPDDLWLKQKWFEWQYKLDCNPPQNQLLQPLVSAAHFYGRIAILPYQAGVWPPTEQYYVLGEDRPDSPVCYRKYYMPLSLKGLLYQSAAVTGLGYAIP
jgi:hypothetical protein